jgi:hypothetical protein
MKIIYKSIIPIQKCYLCKSEFKLKHKDLKHDLISLNFAIWRCPLCKETQKVDWGENKDIK